MLYGFDASTPPLGMPQHTRIVFGYIGGDTPHVWTKQEWARFGKRRKVPIFVPKVAVGGASKASVDAYVILRRLYELRVPKGNPVVMDMENNISAAYLRAVRDILHWYGYRVWVYGSLNHVFSNPMCDGYFVADWSRNKPFIYHHNGVVATQWKSEGAIDRDAVRFWVGMFTLKPW